MAEVVVVVLVEVMVEACGRSGASAASRVEVVERSGGGGTVVVGGVVMVVMVLRSESAMNMSALVCGRAGVSGVRARPRVGQAVRCAQGGVSPPTIPSLMPVTAQAQAPPSRPATPTPALVRRAGVCGHCGRSAAAAARSV